MEGARLTYRPRSRSGTIRAARALGSSSPARTRGASLSLASQGMQIRSPIVARLVARARRYVAPAPPVPDARGGAAAERGVPGHRTAHAAGAPGGVVAAGATPAALGAGDALAQPHPGYTSRSPAEDEREIWIHLDRPVLERVPVLGGTLEYDGWACALEPIVAIEVLLDGIPVSAASHGYVRRDVRRAHAHVPGAGKSGFRGVLDLTGVAEGAHAFELRARTTGGVVASVLGRVTVSATPPPEEGPGVPDWDGQWAQLGAGRPPAAATLAAAATMSRCYRVQPRFGFVVVVREHDPELVADTLASLRAQAYPGHETVVVDDGSTDPRLSALLAAVPRADPRVRVLRHELPLGQARALSAGLAALATDFVALVGAEDVLSPLALHSFVRRVNERPATDVLYSDSDRIAPDGERYHPAFKPDWSPHLLLATDYLCGLLALRRDLVVEAGGIDATLPGAHAHDLALRVTERAAAVEHVADVLYSARLARAETPADRSPFARGATREAIERALVRRGVRGSVEATARDGIFRVRRALAEEPLVSILVPTASTRHIGRCVGSVLERTRYRRYELLVLDTSCGDPVVKERIAELASRDPRVRVLEDPRRPFNFAATNNRGAERAQGEFLLALNDDTEVLEPDWLTAMVGVAVGDPRVGVVGARLLYPSGRIQHAGVVLGIGEIAGHAFRHFPADHPGYLGLGACEREVGAATFACALVRRSVWEELAGLDEVNLPLSYNDVDFCLRARAAGHQIVYTPEAKLLHFESATRGGSDASVGYLYVRRRWREALARDPYYNPNLTLAGEDFGLDLEGDDA